MSNKNILKIDFNYRGTKPDYDIIFTLRKFDSTGLSGDFSRFCVLRNVRGEELILSDAVDNLKNFISMKNRLIAEPIGGSKRRSNKAKSTKRKSTKKKSFKKK